MRFEIEAAGRRRTVEVTAAAREWRVSVDGQERAASWAPGSLILDGRSYEVSISEPRLGELTVFVNGVAVPVVAGPLGVVSEPRGTRPTDVGRVPRARLANASGPGSVGRVPRAGESIASGPAIITAPMPGRIVKVLVRRGDRVSARQGLVVIEAMKMENELRSPRDGIVADVRVAEGTSVEASAVLVVVE